MLLGLLVVVDTYEEDVACVVGYLGWIVLLLDLVDGSFCGMVEFQLATPTSFSLGIVGASSALLSLVRQFNDECRLGDIATRNHHEVGIALACGVLAMDDILVLRPDIGNGKHTGKRVLIVVGEYAGVLIVGKVDCFCHGLLVAGDGGSEKVFGILYCFG